MIAMNSKEYFFNEVIKERCAATNGPIRVLELGCGTASYVPAMIEKYPQLEYVGIDPMIESFKTAEKILKDVPRSSVSFQLGYDEIEGLVDESFDVVISFSVLEHVKQLDSFMTLANRYLKKGGLMVHRYDLGHALYPATLKDTIHVTLGNILPAILPETKFVRYVPMDEVVAFYVQLLGESPYKFTYHQMPNQKALENVLRKTDEVNGKLYTDIYEWEFANAKTFAALPLPVREKLFPTVAVWGQKK